MSYTALYMRKRIGSRGRGSSCTTYCMSYCIPSCRTRSIILRFGLFWASLFLVIFLLAVAMPNDQCPPPPPPPHPAPLQARAARERQAAARRDKHAQRLLRAKYLQAKAEIAEQVQSSVLFYFLCCRLLFIARVLAVDISFSSRVGVRASRLMLCCHKSQSNRSR